MRYHGNDNQTQMVLGWLFGENNRQPLDNLHYVQDAPGDTHGTENNNFSKYKKLYFSKGVNP